MQGAGNPVKGIALVVLATLCFAASDVVTKHLAQTYPVPWIMAVRYVLNAVVLAVLLAPREGAGLWRTQRTGLVVMRALSLALGSLTAGLALKLMPVGETIAIMYLAPLVVLLLAGPLLGERVPGWTWALSALGFLGMLLIARPGSGLNPLGVALALTNVVFGATYHLMTRTLTRTETTTAMLFHTAIWGSLVFVALTLALGDAELPDLAGLVGMLAMGSLATMGHFLFTAAYREAPAPVLAPVNYIHLVWAGGLGFLVFGHLPDLLSILGMALVAGAGVTVAILARRRHLAVEAVQESEFG